MAAKRIKYYFGRGTYTAVIKIHHRSVKGERLLYLKPEVFVLGGIAWVGGQPSYKAGAKVQGVIAQCGKGEP